MNAEKSKMLNGELYDASDAQLVADRRRCRILLAALNQSDPAEEAQRAKIRQELIPNGHATLHIEPPFYCDYGYNISTGENVYFNFDCVALDVAPITIGNRVMMATKVQLLTATHPLDAKERASGLEYAKRIQIGDDVWIGAGALILPGVTIGERSVIAAGAVVTKDVPPDTLMAGNPARAIKDLSAGR